MKFNILNFKDIEDYNKSIIFTGLYFFMLSIFMVIIMFNYNFMLSGLPNIMISYSLYFILNFLGMMLILTQLNNTITKYKEQIIGLSAVNQILESDKSSLFKKIDELQKRLK